MSRPSILGGDPVRTKPFPAWPVFDQTEERALLDVLHGGKWWSLSFGEGVHAVKRDPATPVSKVTEFQEAFAHMQGGLYGLACSSGTAAIEVALKALGVGPGDEVIVPPYTFIATATAPLSINAVPVFCDIDPDTYNLDPRKFEAAITPRTKAVIPVHFAGMAADMEAILRIAEQHGIAVLEDAAHAHGGRWNDRGLGFLGKAGTFSFQVSKNMTAGEGGMITTNDSDLAVLCESYLWSGRKLGRAWYEHFRLGWNYRLTDFQAALLLAQLRRVEEQTARRMANASYLSRALRGIPGIRPLAIPTYATRHSFHIYILRFRAEEFGLARASFLAALSAEGIPCSAGYAYPLYKNAVFLERNFFPDGHAGRLSPFGSIPDYAAFEGLCPNVERACGEAIWLEHRLLLGDREDMDDITRAICKIYSCREALRAIA